MFNLPYNFEVLQTIMSVSPNQLVSGRLPYSSFRLVNDIWTGERGMPTNVSTFVEDCIKDSTNKSEQAHSLVKEISENNHDDYVIRYN